MKPILKIIIVFILLIILKKLLKKFKKYFEIMDVYQGVNEITTGTSNLNISLSKEECEFYSNQIGKQMTTVDQPNNPYGCFIFKENGNIIWNPTGEGFCLSTHSCLIKDINEILLNTYELIANLSKDDIIKVYHKGIYKGSFVIQNKVDTSSDELKNITWKNQIANKPVFGFGNKNVLNPDDPSRVMFSGSGMIGNISIMGAFDDKWYDANVKQVEFKIVPKPIRMPTSNSPYLYDLKNSNDLFYLQDNDTVNVYQKGKYLDFFIVGKHNTFPGSDAIEIFAKHNDPNINNLYKPIQYSVMSPGEYTFNGKGLYGILNNKGTLSSRDWNFPLKEYNVSFKKVGYPNPFLTSLEDFKKIKINDTVHIFEKNIEIANFIVKDIEQGGDGLDAFKIKSVVGGNTVIGWGNRIFDADKNKNISGTYFNKYIINNVHKFGNVELNGKQSWKIDSIEDAKWLWGAGKMQDEADFHIRIKYTPITGFPTPAPTTSPPPTSPPPTTPPVTTPPPISITSINNVFLRNILSPVTSQNPEINKPYTQAEMNLFNNNNIDYTKFGVVNKQWFYDNKGICVGLGDPDDTCDASKYYCVGGSRYGSFIDQRKTVLEHIDYILKNKEFHPNCPLNLQIDRTITVAAITISPISFYIKENEEGFFGIVLEKKPVSDVYIDIKADENEFAFSKNKLTFTESNWFSPQRVIVTALDEFDINNTRTFNITLEISSQDLDYNSLENKNIIVNKLNNDFAKYFLTPTNFVLNEDEEVEATIVLNSKPTHEVIFDIENTAFTQVSVEPSKVVFTPFNWNKERSIKIKGLEDSIIDGDSNSELRFKITTDDNNYSKLSNEVIKIKVLDSKKYENLAVNYKCSCVCENNDPTKCNCNKCFKIDNNISLNEKNDLGSNDIKEILHNYANTFLNIKKTGSYNDMFYFMCKRHRIVLPGLGILNKATYNNYKNMLNKAFSDIASLMLGINKNMRIDFSNYNREIITDSNIISINKLFNIYRFKKIYYKFYKQAFSVKKTKNTTKTSEIDINIFYLEDYRRWIVCISKV
jgi:hypothetical protein